VGCVEVKNAKFKYYKKYSLAMIIGVLGSRGDGEEHVLELAYELGTIIAEHGHDLVCGGLGGVMEAAAKGARKAGGLTIGVLPGSAVEDANQYISAPVATGMGVARNTIIVRTARVSIAVGGWYGTLSEIAFALNIGRPVVSLHSWDITRAREGEHPLFKKANSPQEALEIALELASRVDG